MQRPNNHVGDDIVGIVEARNDGEVDDVAEVEQEAKRAPYLKQDVAWW